jgi:hypothetical protein
MEPGAQEVTARHRPGPRLQRVDGRTYLLPTVIHCTSAFSPLANREFLLPFVSVVDVTEDDMQAMPAALGSSLVVTAITNDQPLIDRLLGSSLVGRLNLGPIQTNQIVWDQPHEGNLFEHLRQKGIPKSRVTAEGTRHKANVRRLDLLSSFLKSLAGEGSFHTSALCLLPSAFLDCP